MSILIPVGLALLAAICWGINAHMIRIGMRGENHFHALFIRSVFSIPILFGVVLIWKGSTGVSIYFQDPIIYYTLISATLVLIGDTLFLIGLKNYSVNVMAPITASYPIFTSLTLIITGQERVGIMLLVGTIVIIIGVGVVTSNDITKTFDKKAILLGSGAALCWGVSIYFVRLVLLVDGTDPIGLTGLRILIIGLSAILVYEVGKSTGQFESTKATRGGSWKYMTLSGIFSWVLGSSFFFWSVQMIGAAIPTPISSTNPVIASIIGQLLGIEEVNLKQFTGILMTVVGIIVIVTFS